MKCAFACLIVAAVIAGGRPAVLGQSQAAVGSKITYQGQLKLDDLPIDEPCEFIFSLYDAPTDGTMLSQSGSLAAPIAVEVKKGLVTVELDLGAAPFDGGERWLEIAVRKAVAGGNFVTLTPRQRVSVVPYALHAQSGGDESSLDQAYNKGGPGAGRVITANAGPMSIEGPDGLNISGSVGIGTTNPQSKLEVAGWIHSTLGGFKFPDGTVQTTAAYGTGGTAPLASAGCLDGPGGSPADALCINSSGNVGIGTGTSNILGRLHLTGPSDVVSIIHIDNNNVGADAGALVFARGLLTNPQRLGEIEVDESRPGIPLDLNASTPRNVTLAIGGGDVGVGGDPINRLSVFGDADITGALGVGMSPGAGVSLDVIGAIRTADQFISTLPGGTPPLVVASSTLVTNLNADLLDGNHASAFALAAHTHDGADITTGTVAEPRIDAAIARDNEVFGIVTANDGPGSGLDADFLDGLDSTAFAILNGQSGGQSLHGGTGAGEHLTLDSTSHGTKGNVFISPTTGQVGIGTLFPAAGSKLGVAGDVDITGVLHVNTVTSRSPLHLQADGVTLITLDDGTDRVGVGNPPPSPPAFPLDVNGSIHTNASLFAATSVGVGTTTPSEELHVVGDALVTGTVHTPRVNNNGAPLELQTNATTHLLVHHAAGNVGVGSPPPSPPAFPLDVHGSIHTDASLLAATSVGVGTNTPSEELHVVGDALVTGTVHTPRVNNNGGPLDFQTDGNSHIRIDHTTGFVGVGPTLPNPILDALHVNGCVRADCFRINEPVNVPINVLDIVKRGLAGVDLLPNVTGSVTIHPTAVGTQTVLIPAHVPAPILGTAYGIQRLTICYRVGTTASFITTSRIRQIEDNGSFTDLLSDGTDLTSRTWFCQTFTLGSPPAIAGPIHIGLDLTTAGTTSAHDIEIGKITLTLVQL